MKGAVILERKVAMRDWPEPVPGPGQVLVRVRSTTLCGSDLHLYRSSKAERKADRDTWGYIGGHETAGVVEALGTETKGLSVGDRVVVYHIEGCGHCKYCASGWMLHCTGSEKVSYGYDAHGGLAPLMLAKDDNCIRLPDELTFGDGSCCACGTGTAFQALRRISLSGRDRFAVFGLGPVGLSAVMLAKAMGAQVIGLDMITERLELAAQLGADQVIDLRREADPVRAIQAYGGSEGVEAAGDFSGSPIARNQALDCVRVWGRVAFVGEGNKTTIEPSPQILHRQLTVIGSWVYGTWELCELLEFLTVHRLHPDRMITHQYPLGDVAQAFDDFDSGKTGKVQIVFP